MKTLHGAVLCAACWLALGAATAFAQGGGGGGGCQAGGGGGGGTTGGTGTQTAGLSAGSMSRMSGGAGAINSPLVGLQLMQATSAQLRQGQLNALAANAQIRAETQSMWQAARQRKQQALALREAREKTRTFD